MVALHPSCGLDTQPEWVIFNEFVLTTRPYIRTVSEVKAEWCVASLPPILGVCLASILIFPRLIEFAANYFDLASFPDGETKRALQRAWNKRAGKESTRGNGAIANGPAAKKVRKNKAAALDG